MKNKRIQDILRRPWASENLWAYWLLFVFAIGLLLDTFPLGRVAATYLILALFIWDSGLIYYYYRKSDLTGLGGKKIFFAITCVRILILLFILSDLNSAGRVFVPGSAKLITPMYYSYVLVFTAAWLRGRLRARRFGRIMAQRRAGHTVAPDNHQA